MTLAEELICRPSFVPPKGREVSLLDPPFRLAFNGELSEDEKRMLEQFAFEELGD